jgi:hypothetical protein
MEIMEIIEIMKENYLYIFGVLVILLVAVVYFYYSKMKNNSIDTNVNQDHTPEVPNIKCDGDKCVLQSQSNDDRCDENRYD